MGLIESSIPAGGVLDTTVITTGGALIAGSTVAPAAQPYTLTRNSSSDLYSDIDSFDDSIYRILSMQDDMKTVSIQGKVSNEFELFLSYGEQLTAGHEMSPEFVAFDSYLGSLGV